MPPRYWALALPRLRTESLTIDVVCLLPVPVYINESLNASVQPTQREHLDNGGGGGSP